MKYVIIKIFLNKVTEDNIRKIEIFRTFILDIHTLSKMSLRMFVIIFKNLKNEGIRFFPGKYIKLEKKMI